jgi:hypothetical protein
VPFEKEAQRSWRDGISKASMKQKTVLSSFVTSHCCGDLIKPFSNFFLDLICFILAF